MNLALFLYGKMQESGLIEVIPLIGTLSRDTILFFPVLSPLRVHHCRMAAVAEGLAVGSPFVSILSSLRAHHRGSGSG